MTSLVTALAVAVVRLPGVAAVACFAAAAYELWGKPAALIVFGVALLLVDRRMP